MQIKSRLLAGLALGLSLMVAACSGGQPQGGPPMPQVTVAVPLQRDIVDWDEYIGRFEAVEDVELRPRVSGTIERVLFTDGQNVRRGQPLFIIDPRPYRATLMQAQASQSRAQATLANASTEEARAKTLFEAQAISREEYEQKQAALRSANADAEAARAQVSAALLNLSFTTVRSPISGRVSDRRVSQGNYAAEGQTVLTRVVSIDPIWFRFEGAESLYLKYLRLDEKGERRSSRYAPNPVEIQLADESGWRHRGRMDFIDNAIDANSGTIRAHAVVPNPDGFLTPGLFGRARLLGSGSYRAMLIPDEAITTDQTRKIVLVLGKDGKVQPRPIIIGPKVEGLRVVKEGLAPTDKVVIEGGGMLQPGMPVKAREVPLKPRAGNDAPRSAPESAPPPAQATEVSAGAPTRAN